MANRISAWGLARHYGQSRELTAGSRLASNGLRNLLEADPKHIVEDEGRAFERRQSLQGQHRRCCGASKSDCS
jgi:hypothetical protein